MPAQLSLECAARLLGGAHATAIRWSDAVPHTPDFLPNAAANEAAHAGAFARSIAESDALANLTDE